MIPQLADRLAGEALSVERQRKLIAAVQDAPVVVSADGRATFGYSAASESALAALTESFIALFRKEAAAARVLDREDAFAEAVAEFVDATRRYDLGSSIPFSATIRTIIRRHLSDVARTSDIISVKENVAARYWRLMHAHDHSFSAAYNSVRQAGGGLDPLTFLAAHYALQVASLEIRLTGPYDAAALTLADTVADISTDHDDVVNAALVDWLWTLVDADTARALRLRYGFPRDLATEAVTASLGLHDGEVLTERQVGAVLGWSQTLTHRRIVRGLSTMREALQELVNEEEA
ncbi:MAG: hypothetical protein ACRC0L_05700 [Angustibacter sp.]